MELILLRHGQAGSHIPLPEKDYERALTVAGRAELEGTAKALKGLKLNIDHICTSPLTRAKETAEIVAARLKKSGPLEEWDELKPEGSRKAIFERLAGFSEDSTVLFVGHEPLLSEIIGDLIAGRPGGRIVLKKAGAARITIDVMKPKPSGSLRWLLTGKQLRKL